MCCSPEPSEKVMLPGRLMSHQLPQIYAIANNSIFLDPEIDSIQVPAKIGKSCQIVFMRRYILVAIGGGIGSVVRFGITEFMAPLALWPPLSLLVVNTSGCFLISFLNFVSDPSGDIYLGPRSRLFFLVGICGGYTTFSSFSLLSFNAARNGSLLDLWLNIGLSHILCLFSVWLGAIVAAPFPRAFRRIARLLRS